MAAASLTHESTSAWVSQTSVPLIESVLLIHHKSKVLHVAFN